MSGGVSKLAQVAVGAVIGFVQGGPVGAAIGAGLAFYAAEQQEKLNTKSPLRDNEPSAQTVRSSKAPARFILGRVSTGGVLVWAQEQAGDQADGEWLHLVYVLCEGAVDALENIYLGEEEIATYGENASYELVVNPAAVNAFLKANCPDWKDEQIGRGLSFVRLSLKYSAEKFPSGIPDARFIVRGRNDIYDPRTGMAIYTENTALHILWFLRNRCGVPDDEIVFETFASGANVCDESVVNPDGTTSPRYRSSCVIGADEQRTNVLQKLETACGGKAIRVGGRWMFQAGAYYGPYDFEITEDMVIGTITGSTEPTNDAAINTVRGTFIDPSQSWTETDYPEVSIADWVAADGGEAAETLTFSYVSNAYQAQRLANIELRKRRAGGTINVPMNFLGYNCRPGRAVRVNLPLLNILGEFIVTNWSMGSSEGCTASLQQYEAAQFDDAVGQPYNPIGFINLPAGGLGSPTGLAWTVDESAEVTQGVLSWVQPAGIVTAYAVTVRQGTTAVQAQQVPATTLQLPLSGLPSGNYTMSVAALGPLTRSGEASITVSIDGPPIPESCVVQATIDTITLIPGNTLHGLNGGTYEYFFSTNPQATSGEYVGQGLSLTHTGLAFATNYAYFVRSKNAYGVSAFLKVVASTSSDMSNMLGALKDQINNGQLAPVLREDIALITAPPTVPGSVNQRVEGVRADLGEQITEVSNHVTEVQNELQRQIDEVADLADSMPYDPAKAYTAGQGVLGADGKLYQAKGAVPAGNAPPNATYWTDIGQAVQTANGLAARVGTVETAVSDLDGIIDAQAEQIDGLRTSISGKADSSVVDSLTSRVKNNEDGLSSQGQALTGLSNSLNTTNLNVSAAQKAADDAATLAGGKGKTIVQAAAPAVADRLPQNLWIDITGGANTPKRWNGTAWVAVTDKVATDAAAAAASALTQLSGKADASTVQALSNTVDQQGAAITATGQAITNINTSLTQVGGENLVYNSSFEKSGTVAGMADGWNYDGSSSGVVRTPSLVQSSMGSGLAQRLDISGLTSSTWARIYQNGARRFKVAPGGTYTASVYMRGTPGLRILPQVYGVNAAGTSSGSWAAPRVDATDAWQRLPITFTVTAETDVVYAAAVIYGGASAPAGFIEIDLYQVERGDVMTGWRDNGQVNAVDTQANAAATTALTGRVKSTEDSLTSTSNQLTQLDNSIGDIGGENLLYNPTFNKVNAADATLPDGWQREGAAANVSSMVVSWLNSGERAFRSAVTGVTNVTPYLSLIPIASQRARVAAGQAVTTSVYARRMAESGLLSLRIYHQWINDAGTVISSPSSNFQSISVDGSRLTYTSTAPAGAVRVVTYYRVHGATATATNGTFELARPQVEYGSRATGWRDNGQVNAANNSATSAAVDSLSSTVGQQGSTLTSVAGRTTTLENAVNSTTNGLATKASASALDAVTNRVSLVEGVNTSQSNSITDLSNTVGAIQGNLGASGLDPAPGAYWQFDTTIEGWSGINATVAASAGAVRVTPTTADPQFVSSTGALTLSIPGAQYTKVRVGLTRRGGSAWTGTLYYSTTSHGFATSYRASAPNPNIAVGQSAVVEWDMANLAAGGTDWVDSTIGRLRFNFANALDAVWDVDWIAVGRVGPSASSKVVQSLSSEVTQQGNTLSSQGQVLTSLSNRMTDTENVNSAQASAISQIDTKVTNQGDALSAQAQRLDGIYVQVNPEMEGDSTGLAGATGSLVGVWTEQSARVEDGVATGKRFDTVQSQVGDVSASVQMVSETVAGVDGRVSAISSWKTETNSNGKKVATGIIQGSDGSVGEILLSADRVAIINGLNGAESSLFVFQNGQLFLNSALINQAFIQSLIVGMTLTSQAVNSQGLPLIDINMKTGSFTVRGQDANGSTLLNNGGLYVYDASGIERTAVGRLT